MAKYCPNCGLDISDKVKYCPKCGADIDYLMEGSGNLPTRRRSSGKKNKSGFYLEILVCLIVLFLGFYLIYYVEYLPVGQIFGNDVTISQLNSACEKIDQVPIFHEITEEQCEGYKSTYFWGTFVGFLLIVIGIISPFVVLYFKTGMGVDLPFPARKPPRRQKPGPRNSPSFHLKVP